MKLSAIETLGLILARIARTHDMGEVEYITTVSEKTSSVMLREFNITLVRVKLRYRVHVRGQFKREEMERLGVCEVHFLAEHNDIDGMAKGIIELCQPRGLPSEIQLELPGMTVNGM